MTSPECPDLDSTNLTVALRSFEKITLYKPKIYSTQFERHMTVRNLTVNRPLVVSVMRDSDMKTLFLMNIMMVTDRNGTHYTSIWMR